MDRILLTVVIWIHLLSAVAWIGGIFTILYVVLPSTKQSIEQPVKIIGMISKRFIPNLGQGHSPPRHNGALVISHTIHLQGLNALLAVLGRHGTSHFKCTF